MKSIEELLYGPLNVGPYMVNETVGAQGLRYEKELRDSIKSVFDKCSDGRADIRCPELERDAGAGFDAHSPDLEITLDGVTYAIEAKLGPKAQMGSTKIKYAKGQFYMEEKDKEQIDPSMLDVLIDLVADKKRDIDNLLAFLRLQPPDILHNDIDGIPFRTSRDAWGEAVEKGLIRPINIKERYDQRFIVNHYAQKNCNYIQIGKLGLFYLNQNPLNLPIPKLKGDVNLEIRLKRGGSRHVQKYDTKVATVELRVSGRLQFKSKSPYSLDKPKDVAQLFQDYIR